ncbi:hypothetical protein AGMMS50218_17370 [Actinomycetota bacterium]|nr:hypothetical protein AGMMS50218_17370 [Actinomycetota bacterium]
MTRATAPARLGVLLSLRPLLRLRLRVRPSAGVVVLIDRACTDLANPGVSRCETCGRLSVRPPLGMSTAPRDRPDLLRRSGRLVFATGAFPVDIARPYRGPSVQHLLAGRPGGTGSALARSG